MRAALLALGLAACWRGDEPPPAKPIELGPAPRARVRQVDPAPGSFEAVFLRFTGFIEEMCTCRDKPCADAVQAEMNRWSEELAASSRANELKPTDDQVRRMSDAASRYADCMIKALNLGP